MGLLKRFFGDKNLAPETPVDSYNRGVSYWHRNDYKSAAKAFEKCLNTGSISDQAAYAIVLCQNKMGADISIPKKFADRSEEVASVHMAGNFVCNLIQDGHAAALTERGETSEVTAHIMGSTYLFQITEMLGTFDMFAWRIEGSETIPVTDSGYNPNPSTPDKFVISSLERIPELPLALLPQGGLPSELTT